MSAITIEILTEGTRAWADQLLATAWGSTQIVTRGRIHEASELPGLVAMLEGEPAGLMTYRLDPRELEIISLNSMREGRGIGSALLAAVAGIAREQGCGRVWLITSNDNTRAIRFYQKRGYRLSALYPNALETSRRLKPSIPMVGIDGIPLRDEIELELTISDKPSVART